MKLSKSLMSAGVLTAVAVGSFAGVGAVNAFDNQDASRDSLIDRIVTDTGADRTTVEASFEAHHQEMEAQMKQKQSERLQSLVDSGTITAEQKSAIEAKHDEMEAQRESWKDQDLTREEMRDKMDADRDEFESWAESQGIDLDAVRPTKAEGFGHGGPGGHGPHHSDYDDDSTDSTAQES